MEVNTRAPYFLLSNLGAHLGPYLQFLETEARPFFNSSLETDLGECGPPLTGISDMQGRILCLTPNILQPVSCLPSYNQSPNLECKDTYRGEGSIFNMNIQKAESFEKTGFFWEQEVKV